MPLTRNVSYKEELDEILNDVAVMTTSTSAVTVHDFPEYSMI